jgi:phage terminase large subunit-like protein
MSGQDGARRPGRKRKKLVDRLLESSFRPNEHKPLLREEILPEQPLPGYTQTDWDKLRDLQAAFVAAQTPREQTEQAYAFARAARGDSADDLSLKRYLYASLGPREQDYVGRRRVFLHAWIAWGAWELRYGLAWRLKQRAPHELDKNELAARFGDGATNIAAIGPRLAEYMEAFAAEWGDEPIPDPPSGAASADVASFTYEELVAALGEPGAAERTIRFFPRFFRFTRGPRAGEPFELEEFQKDFLREFHRRDELGLRVYQRGYLIVPGGNGKTPLAAGDGIEGVCEIEDAPEVYCVAGAKDQAGIGLEFASEFVRGTDDWPGELRRWLSVSGNRIKNHSTGGTMKVLPSSGSLLEGKGPSRLIVDELHAFETKKQEQSYSALSGKLFKRGPEAYLLAISTAGRGEDNILRKTIKAMLSYGPVEQDGYLTIVRDEARGRLLWMWAAPLEPVEGETDLERLARVQDLDVIRQVNPASWTDPALIVQGLWDEGVGELEFRRLARNEWVASKGQWLRPGRWEQLADRERGWPAAGTQIVLGFDGSYNSDSTGLVGWVVGDDYGFVVGAWERPEDEDDWRVPRGEVKQAVDEAMERWDVRELVCDPPGWIEEINEWAERYEEVVTVMWLTNERKLMAEACREFYSGVEHGRIRHDGDPRLGRHLANAFVKETPDGAYIVKEHRGSVNKIDLAVAAVVARHRAMRVQPKKSRKLVSW